MAIKKKTSRKKNNVLKKKNVVKKNVIKKKNVVKKKNVLKIVKKKNVISLGKKPRKILKTTSKAKKLVKTVSKKGKLTIEKSNSVKLNPRKKLVVKKRLGLKVVSKTKQITPEQKTELERLHKILSDSFIRQMLIEIGGENALIIVRNFYGSHSDEELSKNLTLRISDVRATLNRLHNEGLVKYVREKDSETGWYSYSWTLNKDRIVEWVSQYAEKGLGSNGKEGIDYYFCPKCGLGSICEFERAHDDSFKCQKCTKPLEFLEEEHFSSINKLMRN